MHTTIKKKSIANLLSILSKYSICGVSELDGTLGMGHYD